MEWNLVLYLFLANLLAGSVYSDDSSPTVTIAQGTLVGQTYNTKYGSYYGFQGIPYAKPPVGDLRFKPPVPADPWNGTFQALDAGPQCVQGTLLTWTSHGEEDCLFLNVYTPQYSDSSNLLPVMVWIHGGGYVIGSGSYPELGPGLLLNEGIVFVTLNYRLSALGFLSTQDEVVPGNMGLKDQVLALRWVQQNIATFGGDPEKVTIFGISAGGSSVSLQVISPMSTGLFRAAIVQSGCGANGWSLRHQNTARETAFHLGNALGYTGNSSQELVDFLRTVSAEDINRVGSIDLLEFDAYRLAPIPFAPVAEPAVDGEESFLPDSPIDLLAQGKFNDVPVIIGTTSAESLMFLASHGMLDGTVPAEVIDRNLSLIFKPELRYCRTEPCGDEMIAEIKNFYFGDDPVTNDNLQNLVDMTSDIMFVEGVMYAAEQLSSHGTKPVYLYEFSYDGGFSTKSRFPGSSNFPGALHGGDGSYIFDNGVETEPGSVDALLRQEMLDLWTNFAKTGNPTPDSAANLPTWLPYSICEENYLDIDAELTLKNDFRKARMDFWRELYGTTQTCRISKHDIYIPSDQCLKT